ncbi:protein ANKUB1-like [Neosynchiropus ocellatus]
MRIFVCYGGSWETFDVPRDQSVGIVKQLVKDAFLVRLLDDAHYLELNYAGAAMQDSWVLSDVGVTSGSLIKCLIKSEQKAALFVFNVVTKDMLPVQGSERLMSMSVAQLKSIVSEKTNLPVSVFRLRTSCHVQLYDCNTLQDYGIKEGAILYLDTWDGWVEFLQGCLLGSKTTVLSHFSQQQLVNRFQQRVALYIASSLGHLDLACWLLERKVHADEPVGVHPSRQWCHQAAHRESRKRPVHVAAERGQLLILKLFITKDILALTCQDLQGRDALRIAIQNRHVACVCFLAEKLCSVASFWNISLPMRVYLGVKLWIRLSQRNAASAQCQNNLVDMCLVDGYNHSNMSSKLKGKEIKTQEAQYDSFPTEVHDIRPSRGDVLKKKSRHEKEKLLSTKQSVFVDAPMKSSNIQPGLTTIQSKSTPRENAVYHMTVASHFTEKPWAKQLQIARTLAKKHFKTSLQAQK